MFEVILEIQGQLVVAVILGQLGQESLDIRERLDQLEILVPLEIMVMALLGQLVFVAQLEELVFMEEVPLEILEEGVQLDRLV